MKSTGSSQLLGIQYLRAAAALMVVLHHSLEQVPAYATLLASHGFGGSRLRNGVDLFFVISGFIMVLTSSRVSPGDFAVRRVIRIVPLYWVLTTALLLVLTWRPELFHNTVTGFSYAVKSLLFIPYANPAQNGMMYPLLVPGWSLNLEMFFYVIFALILFLPRPSRLPVAAAIFVAVVWLAPKFQGTAYGPEIAFFGNFKLLEFLFGMMLAQWYVHGLPRLAAPVAAALGVIGFAALFLELPGLSYDPGDLMQVLGEVALPSVVVVFAMLSLEPALRTRPARFIAYLGDASYSLYLSHIFTLGAARFLWLKAGLDRVTLTHALAFEIAGIAASIGGAILVYRCVELPLLNGIQGVYRRWRKPAPRTSAVPS
jgi:exopolysaccharide production protein ExoZ